MKIFLMWIVLGSGNPATVVTKDNGDPLVLDRMSLCAQFSAEMNTLERVRMQRQKRHYFCGTTVPKTRRRT